MEREPLSACEAMIMKVIWDQKGDISVPELIDLIQERYKRDYKRTTVVTFLTCLNGKGFISSHRAGRISYIHAEKSEEEYKARHDGLVAAREGRIDPGPDSNFSIWSAGGYIFGYDEIDTTMEVEETPEAREATIAWETRQLGIMDWITNDVDWMTKEVHPSSVRLAWHN